MLGGIDLFLGHPMNYWLELEKWAKLNNASDLIQEIADLRGKIGFYESRIKQLNEFMNK